MHWLRWAWCRMFGHGADVYEWHILRGEHCTRRVTCARCNALLLEKACDP